MNSPMAIPACVLPQLLLPSPRLPRRPAPSPARPRTICLANLARYAAQPSLRIVVVVNEKRRVPIVLGQRIPLLRILRSDQPRLVDVTPDKVSGGNRHALEYARADHWIIICPL